MRYTIIILLIFININLFATSLDDKCLNCHKIQKIPNSMIYRKYLLKYSTKENISKAIYEYIKAPSPDISIMPKPFFSKFPIKPLLNIEDKELNELIELYIKKYDIKKKLRLQHNKQ